MGSVGGVSVLGIKRITGGRRLSNPIPRTRDIEARAGGNVSTVEIFSNDWI